MKYYHLIFVSILLLAGCTNTYNIRTTPSNAAIYLEPPSGSEEKYVGQSPMTLESPKYARIRATKKGYQDAGTMLFDYSPNVQLVLYKKWTEEELENADFGPIPEQAIYEYMIRAVVERILIDPESGRYRFEYPRKTIIPIDSETATFAWIVEFEYNAKNRMGGYTGWSSGKAYFKYNKIIDLKFDK